MTVIIDTTVLIDASKGRSVAFDFLQSHLNDLVASEITRVEILQGARPHELPGIERLMDMIEWLPVFEEVSRRAGELGQRWRRSHNGIGAGDLIIAASAQIAGAQLATLNVKHFPMFPDLRPAY